MCGAGNTRSIADFDGLYFMDMSSLGEYTLSLTPINAAGKYTALWSNGFVKD